MSRIQMSQISWVPFGRTEEVQEQTHNKNGLLLEHK